MRFTYHLPFNVASVHGKISEVGQQLLGTVLTLYKFEQIWGVIDELEVE